MVQSELPKLPEMNRPLQRWKQKLESSNLVSLGRSSASAVNCGSLSIPLSQPNQRPELAGSGGKPGLAPEYAYTEPLIAYMYSHVELGMSVVRAGSPRTFQRLFGDN
jgi:hypothetical protein